MIASEWYSWHFPELVRVVPDNLLFAKLVQIIQARVCHFPRCVRLWHPCSYSSLSLSLSLSLADLARR